MRKVEAITITAMMGSLAIILSLARIQIPFPILTYLKVDFAEIPSFITYFLIGFNWGTICAIIHWVALMLRSGNPIGPTMKFLAVFTNLFGMYVVKRYLFPYLKKEKLLLTLEAMGGIVIRVVSMSILNIIILTILFPYYLEISRNALNLAGIKATSNEEVLTWTLVILGIFNSLHAIVSFLPSIIITKTIKNVLKIG